MLVIIARRSRLSRDQAHSDLGEGNKIDDK